MKKFLATSMLSLLCGSALAAPTVGGPTISSSGGGSSTVNSNQVINIVSNFLSGFSNVVAVAVTNVYRDTFMPNATFNTNSVLMSYTSTEQAFYLIRWQNVLRQTILGQFNDGEYATGIRWTAPNGDVMNASLHSLYASDANYTDGTYTWYQGQGEYNVLVKAGTTITITNNVKISSANNYLGTNYFIAQICKYTNTVVAGGGSSGSSIDLAAALASATNALGVATTNVLGVQFSTVTSGGYVLTNKPIPVIIDCDPGDDVDELGLFMTARYAEDIGLIKVIALTTPYKYVGTGLSSNSAISMEIIARNFGFENIPIGCNAGGEGQNGVDHYGDYLRTNYLYSGLQYPSAVNVWRKCLAENPTNSVMIWTGASAWNIYYFLQSGGDSISGLTGQELTARINHWFIAAGSFPRTNTSPYFTLGGQLYEFNFGQFSGGSVAAWNWLTNRPVSWFGADYVYADGIWTNNLSITQKGNRWRNFSPNSLPPLVDSAVAGVGFPIFDGYTSILLHPEWFNCITGIVTAIAFDPFVVPYAYPSFSTNVGGNQRYVRFNTNYMAEALLLNDQIFNGVYAEQTKANQSVASTGSGGYVFSNSPTIYNLTNNGTTVLKQDLFGKSASFTNLTTGNLTVTGIVASIGGAAPANLTGLNYPTWWVSTARGGLLGSAVANYRGVYFSANSVFNEAASSFRSVDTTSPAWMIQLLHETGGGAEGFDLLRAPATSGNLSFVSRFKVDASGIVTYSDGTTRTSGTGSPEGVVTATVGSIYMNLSGGASTTLYVKTSGTGNTGWTAK